MIKRVESKTDFIKIEHKILDFWDANSIFEKRRKLNENNKHWSFIDGPITANNPMGVHHAWGRTLKDLYNRYKFIKYNTKKTRAITPSISLILFD